MIPIDPGSEYGMLVEYARDQDEYQTLVARLHEDGDSILTRWQLTEDERAALAAGADFNLRIWTFGTPLQPVKLYVAGIDPDDPSIASERLFPKDPA